VLDREVSGQEASFSAYVDERSEQIERQIEVWFGVVASSESPKTASNPPVPEEHRPTIGPDGLIGRVTIPRLKLSAIVREGTGEKTLSLAAGHIPGTALPGAKGNVAVAGHRDTLFRGLREIEKGDVIEFEALNGRFEYEVASTEIVNPEDVAVLQPGLSPELTLVTCYPFDFIGSAPNRFIVKALQVSRTDPVPRLWQEVPVQNEVARKSAPHQNRPEKSGPRRTAFSLAVHHSREVAPGISVGITDVDPVDGRVYGWMWLSPEHRTVWLRDQEVDDPFVFYGGADGGRREIMITRVTATSVSGYLAPAN